MGKDLKIAIIGRGIAGLALAYRLIKRGLKPTVYGSRSSAHRASSAAQGIVCNKGLVWPRQPLFQAKILSLPWLKAWLQDVMTTTACSINQDFDGVFEPYRRQDFQKISSRIYKGQFTGCFRSSNLPSHYLPDEIPDRLNFYGTFFYPGDGWFDPQQLMEVLEDFCLNNGAIFKEEAVVALETNEQNCRVATASGPQHYDKIVIAAGQGSEALLRSIGIENIAFYYHPGQVLYVKNPGWQQKWALVRKTFSLVSRNGLYLGATTEKLTSADQCWSPQQQVVLWHILQQEFGFSNWQMAQFELEDLWGVRVRTSDRNPAIGSLAELDPGHSTRLKNIYLMTGFYKNGLQLADMAASWLEQKMFSGQVDPLGQNFGLDRFQKA